MDKLEGGATEKERLRRILQTMPGGLSVDEACEQLGIHRAYFQELRDRALQSALDGLHPRSPGRPADAAPAQPGDVDRLKQENAELRRDLQYLQVRLQLLLAMPERMAALKGGGTRSG